MVGQSRASRIPAWGSCPRRTQTRPKQKKDLDLAPYRFAAWRWQTLAGVTRNLEQLESAVRTAVATIDDPAKLGSRDAKEARAFFQVATDPGLGAKARGLRRLTEPVRKLSGWAKGCDCHEDALVQGKAVSCPWKGCRAPRFAARLRAFEQEVLDVRTSGAPDIVGLDSQDVVNTLTNLLGCTRVKFQ